MTPWKKALWATVAEVAVILGLHAVLIRWLAGQDLVSKLMAAGPHLPTPTMLTILLFLVVRFLAVLALPGLVLARIGLIVWSAVVEARGER